MGLRFMVLLCSQFSLHHNIPVHIILKLPRLF